MGKHGWIKAGFAVCALALGAGAIAAGAAWAQDGDATPSFLDRVAAKLGIDTPKLEQAIKDARGDELDQAVTDGKLTQEEADRLKERLDNLPADAPFFGGFPGGRHGPKGGGFGFEFGHGGKRGFHLGFAFPGAGIEDAHTKLAELLGISVEQLGDELGAEAASLATVAEAHGKSRDDLKAFIEAEAKARLDRAVADGHLTQGRADTILEKLNGHLDRMIDAEFHFKIKGGRPFRGPSREDVPGSETPRQESESFSLQS